jgi:hypothetical protein
MSNLAKLATYFALVSIVWFVGCRKEPAPVPPVNPPANPPGGEASADKPAEQATVGASEATKIEAAFASLSVEDRALAVKQKICPVSDEPLGAMGTPIKVQVAGQDVFICCDHCEDPLIKDQEKYLAKIGLKPAGDAGPK